MPKILEMITVLWDADIHVAGLRLLNGLPWPNHMQPLLKKLLPTLMDILQMGTNLAQVLYGSCPTRSNPKLLISSVFWGAGHSEEATVYISILPLMIIWSERCFFSPGADSEIP